MKREFHFIVNPASGSQGRSAIVSQSCARLSAAGHRVQIHRTAEPGAATAMVAALPDDVDAVVAVGGDGTVREVAQGLLGRTIPLAICPAGTENLVARYFGIRRGAAELCRTLSDGYARTMDVGMLNGRLFLIVAGIGFDAEVVERMARRRRGHITRFDYVLPGWQTFWHHRFEPLIVVADGSEVYRGSGAVLVGNMPVYGMRLDILRRAVVDDGRLDLCIFPCSHRWKLLLHAWRALCRRHLNRGDVIYMHAAHVHVSSERVVPVETDGDVAGGLPVDVSVAERALRLLVPRPGRRDAAN